MTRRALVVGINDYPTSPLRGCAADAQDWSAALTARGYDVLPLLDREATKTTIVRALEELVRGARWGDRLVFTYSGHGTYVPDRDGDEPDRRDEALVSVDMRTITDDEIHTAIAGVPRGVRLTIISDSCHSGSVSRFAASGLLRIGAHTGDVPGTSRARFLDPSQVTVDSPARKRGLPAKAMLLSGCRDDEVSYDAFIGGRYRGAMTAAALAALPAARNMRDWHKHTLANLAFPQTPQIDATAYQRYGFRPFA